MNKIDKIKVTWKHIKKGEPGSELSCPIALALREKYHLGEGGVVVSGDRIEFYRNQYYATQFNVSRNVRKFIRNYDDGISVRPFTLIKIKYNKPRWYLNGTFDKR